VEEVEEVEKVEEVEDTHPVAATQGQGNSEALHVFALP
jgi:hypothetical protein